MSGDTGSIGLRSPSHVGPVYFFIPPILVWIAWRSSPLILFVRLSRAVKQGPQTSSNVMQRIK